MKKFSSVVCCTLLSSVLLSPYAGAASAAEGVETPYLDEVQDPIEQELGINVLVDTDELSVYQINEDGKLFEYRETVTFVNGKQDITVQKYEVNGSDKVLVEEYSTLVTENKLTGTITVETETGETVDISTKQSFGDNPTVMPMPMATYYGSYISDVRYRFTSSTQGQAIMAGQSPYYKYASRKDGDFIRFQGHADNLRTIEKNLATFGVAGFADDIVKALRAGKVLSYTLIKNIVKGAVKVGPFGAALNLWYYGAEWLKARDDYRKI